MKGLLIHGGFFALADNFSVTIRVTKLKFYNAIDDKPAICLKKKFNLLYG